MMNKSVKNRRVDRISMLLQEYNIEKIIHIKGQHNCLADYLSRNPMQSEPEEIFEEDYGISTLFNGEPPILASVSGDIHPVIGAVVTRSMKKQYFQRTTELDKSSSSIVKEIDSSSLEQLKESSNQSQVNLDTCNQFDIKQIKSEQDKDFIIQKKVKEVQQNPTHKRIGNLPGANQKLKEKFRKLLSPIRQFDKLTSCLDSVELSLKDRCFLFLTSDSFADEEFLKKIASLPNVYHIYIYDQQGNIY
ncbi:unnamed protein product [Rotaria socialis]|uniref:Reverse transcriptase/retrotransposon-derived protein RNase H-like domain-containing protein n=2 Tax=Rotaria socialis TaxID=392032 RepID=A0A817TSW4_9BILA|nr:unnamed protein product [Rotaria socialis]